MNSVSHPTSEKARDQAETLRNRVRLGANRNLLFWYRKLYRDQFTNLPDPEALSILEIGSGTSPPEQFHSNIVTSDILDLDYLDLGFDCHEIDKLDAVKDSSLDVIALTNVVHHLKSPLAFINAAAARLKSGGKIIATEPYFSTFLTLIFKYLHHEPVDFEIAEPVLSDVRGPLGHSLSSDSLQAKVDFDETGFQPFSSISYIATGGISLRLPIPRSIYKALFGLDMILSRAFPKLLASFFIITLTRK